MNLTEIISLNQLVFIGVLLLICLIFFIVVLTNFRKVKNSVKETNKNSEVVGEKVDDLNYQIRKLNADNQEVIKVHKQIKEKSEAMNKMMKQTNRIYKEVLDKKSEIDTKENEFIHIDYDKLNEPAPRKSGDNLTQLLNNINSDKDQISKKINSAPPKKTRSEDSIDAVTKIDIENIKRMSAKELDELFLTLKDYKIILNKEEDYYIEQIEQINRQKGALSPAQRLAKKESIYAEIKEVGNKLKYQQQLLDEVKICKDHLEEEQKTVEKEQEIDNLIDGLIKRR